MLLWVEMVDIQNFAYVRVYIQEFSIVDTHIFSDIIAYLNGLYIVFIQIEVVPIEGCGIGRV